MINRIKEFRKAKGMTQKELASQLGVKQVNISQYEGVYPSQVTRYETGVRHPKLESLIKIADVLDVSFLDLIDNNEDVKKHIDRYYESHKNNYQKDEINDIGLLFSEVEDYLLESVKQDDGEV